MSQKSDESPAKTQAYIFIGKPALEKACREHGLEYKDGDKPGKAPTNYLLQARLYLADAGSKPDAAMEAEMSRYLRKDKKEELLETIKKLDPKTTATEANSNHQLALSIARAVVSQHGRTDAEAAQPTTNVANLISWPPTGHFENGAAPAPETNGGDLAMQDADTLMTALGQAGQSPKHDRPSPSVSVEAKMNQVKRNRLDGAHLPITRAEGWRPAASTQEAASSFVRASGSTFGNATSPPGPSQPSRKSAFWNMFGSSSRAQEDRSDGASFVATGGREVGHDQVVTRLGTAMLDLITTDPAIAALLANHFTSGIREDASSKLVSTEQELLKERKANEELKERVAELEEGLDELQKRHEELTRAATEKDNSQRAVLALVRRQLVEWREAHTRVGVTSFDLLQNVEKVLGRE